MSYEISTEIDPGAVDRRQSVERVAVGGTSTAWRPALDQVWAFLRRNSSLRTDGHNIFVYHHPTRPGAPMDVEFGVEVTTAFEPEGDVVLSNTPGGMVAWTHTSDPSLGSPMPTRRSDPGARPRD